MAYEERSDLEKLQAQWNKLSGLHLRDEPSPAILRCATAAEIAANYAIRHEFGQKSELEPEVVDKFLVWANGLKGKIDRLFVALHFVGTEKHATAKALKASAEKITNVRNDVMHRGRFSNAKEAKRGSLKPSSSSIRSLGYPSRASTSRMASALRPTEGA